MWTTSVSFHMQNLIASTAQIMHLAVIVLLTRCVGLVKRKLVTEVESAVITIKNGRAKEKGTKRTYSNRSIESIHWPTALH